MNNQTTAEHNPAQEESERIATAFLSVFGHPDRRSDAQALVMTVFGDVLHAHKRLVVIAPNGNVDPIATAVAASRMEVWRYLDPKLHEALNPPKKPEPVKVQSGLRQRGSRRTQP
jgi:hypothetical protein